ncbi:hypothetical protein Salat_1702700 [Sesamum alatum]|uniref:Retrovirus-related Pol polyprotein from transposon TNT 1-94-like beta-barrel domain-containing protein n=1 Tax=Sesamum alatum TaxID=300844 RepID=A0AAE2CKA6_9LAMI|nr:hypothetical protein Salat_1702700 [Sesamum alatum]
MAEVSIAEREATPGTDTGAQLEKDALFIHPSEHSGNACTSSVSALYYWIIDSGATNHVCASITMSDSYSKPLCLQFIHLPDGSKKAVQYIGDIKLTPHLTLHDVLYVPEFAVNLISISQLCKVTSYSITFIDNKCILQDHVN